MDFPGHDLWMSSTVGHVYGIVHVSLLLLVNNTKVVVLYELMDYASKGGWVYL